MKYWNYGQSIQKQIRMANNNNNDYLIVFGQFYSSQPSKSYNHSNHFVVRIVIIFD